MADDDQIIYQWNGASPRRFRDLRSDYDVRTLELPESYRCPPAIVALANRLVARNTRRISDRRTVAVRDHDGTYPAVVRCEVLPTPEREAEFVADDIEDRGLRPGDCVVLGRTNRLIRSAADTLSHAGYEACVPRKKSEFDSPALNVLVEALRLANSRHDRVVLRRICLAWEGLTGVAIEPQAVSAAAALVGGDFLRAWVDVTAAAGAGSSEIVLNHLRNELVDALRFPETVERFLDGEWRAWNGDDVGEDGDDPVEEEIRTWKALHRDIVSEYGSNMSLNTYLQQMGLSSKSPPPPANAIRCMTVHGAKGLEFGHVYLIGMAQEVFPFYRALQAGQASTQVEEERRSCFVAITRARETLTLTRARTYYGYSKPPSQFLSEMGLER